MRYNSQNHFLTVLEVSVLLKLSVLTIYKYIREMKLKAVVFGGHYRIRKAALDAFIDAHSVEKVSGFQRRNKQHG